MIRRRGRVEQRPGEHTRGQAGERDAGEGAGDEERAPERQPPAQPVHHPRGIDEQLQQRVLERRDHVRRFSGPRREHRSSKDDDQQAHAEHDAEQRDRFGRGVRDPFPIQRPRARATPPRTAVHATPRTSDSRASASSAVGDRRIRRGVRQARREEADAVRRPVDLVGVFDGGIEHERPDVRSRDVGQRVARRSGRPSAAARSGCTAVQAAGAAPRPPWRPTARARQRAGRRTPPSVPCRARPRAPRTAGRSRPRDMSVEIQDPTRCSVTRTPSARRRPASGAPHDRTMTGRA